MQGGEKVLKLSNHRQTTSAMQTPTQAENTHTRTNVLHTSVERTCSRVAREFIGALITILDAVAFARFVETHAHQGRRGDAPVTS